MGTSPDYKRNMGVNITENTTQDIRELCLLLELLPDEYRTILQPAVERVIENSLRRRALLGNIQDALAQLRLDMKYLIFDLEATRRERDAYKNA